MSSTRKSGVAQKPSKSSIKSDPKTARAEPQKQVPQKRKPATDQLPTVGRGAPIDGKENVGTGRPQRTRPQTVDRWEREGEKIRNNPKNKASVIPHDEPINEAAPPAKRQRKNPPAFIPPDESPLKGQPKPTKFNPALNLIIKGPKLPANAKDEIVEFRPKSPSRQAKRKFDIFAQGPSRADLVDVNQTEDNHQNHRYPNDDCTSEGHCNDNDAYYQNDQDHGLDDGVDDGLDDDYKDDNHDQDDNDQDDNHDQDDNDQDDNHDQDEDDQDQDDDDQDQDDYRNEQEDFGDDDEQDGHEDFHVDDNNGPRDFYADDDNNDPNGFYVDDSNGPQKYEGHNMDVDDYDCQPQDRAPQQRGRTTHDEQEGESGQEFDGPTVLPTGGPHGYGLSRVPVLRSAASLRILAEHEKRLSPRTSQEQEGPSDRRREELEHLGDQARQEACSRQLKQIDQKRREASGQAAPHHGNSRTQPTPGQTRPGLGALIKIPPGNGGKRPQVSDTARKSGPDNQGRERKHPQVSGNPGDSGNVSGGVTRSSDDIVPNSGSVAGKSGSVSKNGSGVQNSQNTTRKSTENPDPDLDDSLRLERRAYQKQDQNAYDVLAKHRASNKATRLPSAQILERCRRQQNLRDKLRDDQEKDDGDDQDDQDDQEEDDGDDQEEDDEEDTNQKSKRGRGRELLPTTEGFYPEPWPKVFARSRAPVYKYLVQLDFFPDRKEYKVTIADYLSDSIVFFVQDNDLYLDLSYYDEFRDDMLKMLVGFISTFRGRCMRQAREVIKQYYLHRIYTKPEDLPEAFNQEEYHQKTIQNVEKLLDRAFFLHDGRDEEGSVNNFMAPAIGDLAERILTMGKKTALFRTYPEIFDVYTSNFIAACSCLVMFLPFYKKTSLILLQLRAALEEYRSGTPVEKPFSEEANSKFYKKAIYCIEKINRNDKHRRKTIGRWDKWAEEARKKRQRQVEKPMARDDEMDIDLD
ncbi:hypothetical protein MSAN_01301600 [Mycena sanguinolenta]|uniref:DUF6532 domain-containing protein n=1 Tax=Mycena sanguinolenta TaxID=230812 RepID=A0A8H6Y9W5_9AGAR|nr:hypothetical protein MSAN_01301600 [Mycena sanguinolenta]